MRNNSNKNEIKKAKWIIEPDGWYIYCSNCYYEPERAEGLYPLYCKRCGCEMCKETGEKISEFEANYGRTI